MNNQNQAVSQPMSTAKKQRYQNYEEVPVYRRQWVFWVLYFTIAPVAIILLVSGDVYYTKRGELKSFGLANRIVAGIIGVMIFIKFIGMFVS